MAASGARAQKPVGSAAWISTEKENVVQLVDQEMEEVEYPVRHEMDWLNEHMAEVFSSNQFNFTEVFKTPGKMRGKTPRTIRKRNVDDSRVPLSEIFSSAHKQLENKSNISPAPRSPAKPSAPAPSTSTKPASPEKPAENEKPPQYPDLTQNLNSFPEYNTDSGFHGMPEQDEDIDEDADEDDDVVLTATQPDSQISTQPLENESAPMASQESRSSVERRNTDASFHSAHEDIHQCADKVGPMSTDPTPKKTEKKTEHKSSKRASEKKDKGEEPVAEPKSAPEPEPVREPEHERVAEEPKPQSAPAPEPEEEPEPEVEQESDHVLEAEERNPESRQTTEAKSSPAKPAVQPSETQQEKDAEKEDMAMDSLDDISSPSDGFTPERAPIRKSSLTFASLPAREPLTKKSLGGARVSRTSHVDLPKLSGTGSFLGRQTGGQRTTQVAFDDIEAQEDNMDVDDDRDASREDADADTRASKLHNKSSTQRLHEKISMLGKLQPSRPTKSIPSVSGLASAQVTYPELPTNKEDSKPSRSSQKSRENQESDPMETEDDWIKPLNTPQKANPPKGQATEKQPSTEKKQALEKDDAPMANDSKSARPGSSNAVMPGLGKSSIPSFSPQRFGHHKSASAFHMSFEESTTPVGSPERSNGPLSASKSKLQSIMNTAKGLFTNTGGVSAAAHQAPSPDMLQFQQDERPRTNSIRSKEDSRPAQVHSPSRQEGRRTRSSTEKEERKRQKEQEDREHEEAEAEHSREQERQKALQLKASQEKALADQEGRARAASSPKKMVQPQKQPSKEPEPSHETTSKSSVPQPSKQADRRPVKPNRELLQKPKPQPVSIRVGSALSRQVPMASNSVSSSAQETNAPAPTPASASKPSTLKKKASNSSLHTASSNGSMKSTMSTQSQRKAQLANEKKREQEEREQRRREEQKRELERKRAASRAEAERRERAPSEDPKKSAQIQAIEKRRLENARRLERQGSQQPSERGSMIQQDKPAQQVRPASRLGSIQPFNRSINQPQPNPAKPPKRGLEDETSHRPAPSKPSTVQPTGDSKRRRTEDEHNPASVRPTMAPPIRQSSIRKPSVFGHGQQSLSHQSGSSIFKTGQPPRPAQPMDMSKYASGKIPFAEPNPAPPPHRTPGASSSKAPVKPSPKYPSGENIQLPEIATDSEDEDSEAEMLPVPKWAQPKELEHLLREQEGMEVDSIFGPVAPFSLEETFKADKKIKKFRERTSSANWSGADGLTQDEIRRDLAERQRLRLNGGWSFAPS